MRLRHALLVLLAERPHTGYELTRRMRETVSLFWSAQHSQIYPELAAMAADGLVGFEASSGPGPRQKKTYAITDAGRDELRDWLGSAYVRKPPRDELLLRAFGSASADPHDLAAVYLTEADRLASVLEEYAGIRAELEVMPEADDPTRPEFGWMLALLHGIATATARHDWCVDAARRLNAGS